MLEQTTRIFKKEKGFAQIDNNVLRDTRLSFAALGLLCHLLSHSEDWVIRVNVIKEERGITKESLQKLFKELAVLGYARLVFHRNEKGQIKGSTWEVYECPMTVDREQEKPAFGETGTIRTPKEKNTNRSISYPAQTVKQRAKKGEGKLEKVGVYQLSESEYVIQYRRKEPRQDLEVLDWSSLEREVA